ncbi:MAG: D-glycero-beta-D-manno-heptose 1-phosphate adenylyltransferase [Armatimonadetes bacterium]|nr:D-glycero-beta-D-manno-heptose 1-phosphate adenylyltransferase [Armatimonadota bacterium]NIM23628.1 D-glycero-beta-D-manno-heptose 1-phosphate adenylyltransferase [Armatimonadota bacterium]NIM67495.1 D-glycero-beta-D-manno-heptose 1-phosphate adenylyltransferase [Armatimonadota bacterium]NIM75991.1 D-glycero-beta-D-manno-heptose 1-phosphate adenylyltransferase [Armatimonadota bacterium]NIN05680.1 D-glycero-beta-D-manno-heptose 1-phosphate adenylyltransferase [Armatimonadota bacterium]
MIEEKIVSRENARETLRAWQEAGKKVVFTNGCFDLIHAGHVRYLEKARALGDKLIVAVNDDDSVRQLKGPDRPIQPVTDRAMIIAALASVDLVVVFPELTTDNLLNLLRPDVLAKGGDYTMETLVASERDFVKSYGGEVIIIRRLDSTSTSGLVERIRGKDS